VKKPAHYSVVEASMHRSLKTRTQVDY
jgi:hypothetical protein